MVDECGGAWERCAAAAMEGAKGRRRLIRRTRAAASNMLGMDVCVGCTVVVRLSVWMGQARVRGSSVLCVHFVLLRSSSFDRALLRLLNKLALQQQFTTVHHTPLFLVLTGNCVDCVRVVCKLGWQAASNLLPLRLQRRVASFC